MQRLHARLTPGQYLRASSKAAVHSFQGTWDSGCTLHACASALAILGRIADPAVVSWRKHGLEADFWDRAAPLYFTGATLTEAADVIRESSQWSLRPVVFQGAHRVVIDFCERELSRGHLVIVSWRPVGESFRHAVLVIGAEGRMQGHRFQPHALLILDPGERDAAMATCNARLNYANPVSGKRARYGTYVTARETFSVVLDGAVSIREKHSSKPP
ncbi:MULTISPECIES: hypothetical protein [Paraburkholderia]|uniref:hypothetical protein n=1 Tax=Paraburkholderia TaxID=1822464 RepID=UPI00225147B9|nr:MULTISPECIES: hypothetical protein [Paraburkholderia]MCX4166317.1 hypothetical protein [Paraburkholderia megapolitana]MDN7161807.1 hypothetical protein [Paraburkholderia sp. CHISQ3]MDQ6498855.1 hypothetical protein [Paraburkholderia megapolitana]